MATDFFQGPQITSRSIKADTPEVAVGDTSGAYAAMADGLAAAGDNIGAALGSIKPRVKPSMQAKIDKATAEGKDSKAARLQGRKDRRDARDDARAKRITKRNEEQLKVTKQRQENKTNRFDERREDGNTPISSFAQVFDKFSTIAKKI